MCAGAERLKGWHDRRIDGFALWGLHHDACAQLAEAVALCVEALHTFGIELSGPAAAVSGSQPATGAFISIADLLQLKVWILTNRPTAVITACLPFNGRSMMKGSSGHIS